MMLMCAASGRSEKTTSDAMSDHGLSMQETALLHWMRGRVGDADVRGQRQEQE